MMKGQGSLELPLEMQKESKQEERMTIDDFFSSLVHAYSTVVMNDPGFDRKVFS